MASLSSSVNSITINFKGGVNNDIDEKLINALNTVIRINYVCKYRIKSLTVSSLYDSHEDFPNSRHNQRKAIDISKINDKSVSEYNDDPEVKYLVSFIQTEFEQAEGRRENFGPFEKLKHGRPHWVYGHDDHIHLSVD